MKTCPACQKQCGDEVMFCEACGTKLGDSAPPADAPSAQPAPISGPAEPLSPDVPFVQPEAADPPAPAPAPPPPVTPPPQYAPPPAYPLYAPPSYPPPPYGQGYAKPPKPSGPVIDAVRETGGSAVMLIASVLMALVIVTAVVSAVISAGGLLSREFFDALYDSLDISYSSSRDYANAVDIFTGVARPVVIATTIFTQMPSVLICLGMFMFYASCRGRRGDIKTGGLTLIKAMMILFLCLIGLAAAFVLIMLVIAIVGGSLSGGVSYSGPAYVLLIIVLVIMCALIAAIILYYAKIISTLGRVAGTVRTGVPDHKVSLYVVVLNFILAIFSLFSAATVPFMSTIYSFLPDDAGSEVFAEIFSIEQFWPSMVESLLSAGLLVLVSVAVLRYRGRMLELEPCGPGAPEVYR